MTLLSTLRSGLAAQAAKHEVKMTALMSSLSFISNSAVDRGAQSASWQFHPQISRISAD